MMASVCSFLNFCWIWQESKVGPLLKSPQLSEIASRLDGCPVLLAECGLR